MAQFSCGGGSLFASKSQVLCYCLPFPKFLPGTSLSLFVTWLAPPHPRWLWCVPPFAKSFEFISPRGMWGTWGQTGFLSFIWTPSLANRIWYMVSIHQMLTELTKFRPMLYILFRELKKQYLSSIKFILPYVWLTSEKVGITCSSRTSMSKYKVTANCKVS